MNFFSEFVQAPYGNSLNIDVGIRVFSYYTKLAMLALKAYVGKAKKIIQKSYLEWGKNWAGNPFSEFFFCYNT